MNLLAASLALLAAAQAPASPPQASPTQASPPAAADGAPGTLGFDIHCMLMLTATLESRPPQTRDSAIGSILYFSARVDVGARGMDLEERLMAETGYFEHADPSAVLQACGAFMMERGAAMTAIGNRITAREERARRR